MIIFHEASHTDPLEQPLRAALGRAFEAVGGDEPDRFWNDVIAHWRPFLESRSGDAKARQAALEALAKQLLLHR